MDLEGEWDVSITNVQHFELTCGIGFSMQLRGIESSDSYDGEIPRDTGIRCPNGFIYPLGRELSNLVFEPEGRHLKVTVGDRSFAVVELQSEKEMKGQVDEGYFPGALFRARR